MLCEGTKRTLYKNTRFVSTNILPVKIILHHDRTSFNSCRHLKTDRTEISHFTETEWRVCQNEWHYNYMLIQRFIIYFLAFGCIFLLSKIVYTTEI